MRLPPIQISSGVLFPYNEFSADLVLEVRGPWMSQIQRLVMFSNASGQRLGYVDCRQNIDRAEDTLWTMVPQPYQYREPFSHGNYGKKVGSKKPKVEEEYDPFEI